jgi:hypothetical protein
MRKYLHPLLIMVVLFAGINANAQRYLDEVFDNDDIVVETVSFATNIDFMTSDLGGANLAIDIGTLSATVEAGLPIGAAYYDVMDESTDLKVIDITMDIYRPDNAVDPVDERPVIVYIHTGNFLPPPLNGSPNGTKTDSAAVNLCMQWAKRGYVAVSCDYRLGWNPIAETVQERRGTLLNAVYRAIHDVKQGVRFLREDAMADNTYEIDETKIVLYGQGSGGYVSNAYMTLDNGPVELFLTKFLPNPFDDTVSYIDTLLVGNIDGWGYSNTLTLYRNTGISADVAMTVNAGGALADESWLEAGDPPMVAFNCIRDDFAPFTEGTVIVPTTLEEVVDVHGANFFIQKCNDLGINDVFAGIPDGDDFTDAARSHYGQTYEASNGNEETVNATPEGLFPVLRPLYGYLMNEASPWEWWDQNSPIAQTLVAPGVTANMASLSSNPDMTPEKGLAYLDSIQGYMLPRVMCALNLPGNWCVEVPENNDCAGSVDIDGLFHTNQIGVEQISAVQDNTTATVAATDTEVGTDCWGEPAFNVSPILNNTLWFTFEGDGAEYTIETGDCGGGLDDYIDFGDTQFVIYSGTSCDNLVPVANGCSEDSDNSVTDNYFAGIDFGTDEGTMYWIMVDGFNGVDVAQIGVQADGQFCIHVSQITVDVNDIEPTNLAVYPNPTTGIVTISAQSPINQLKVYTVLGEVVKTENGLNSGQMTVDMSDLEDGLYIFSATSGDHIITQRVVKK